MALDVITTVPAGAGIGETAVKPPGGAGSGPNFDPALMEPQSSDQATAATRVRSTSLNPPTGDAGAHRDPVAEVAARTGPSGSGIGHRILDRLEAVHRADVGHRAGTPAPARNEPTLKVAARLPGPAEAHPGSIGRGTSEATGQADARKGSDDAMDPKFERLLARMDESSNYVVQTSVLSKTTGSFTSSLNKLISSN